MKSKRCTKCGLEKLETEFQYGSRRKDGTRRRIAFCKSCCAKRARTWYIANKEKTKARAAEWKRLHPRKPGETAAQHRLRYWGTNAATREERRELFRFRNALTNSRINARKYRHAPCVSTIAEIKNAFTGRCFVCGVSEAECSKLLHMDHDHTTGKFRGWLCSSCNFAAGQLKNSADIALRLAVYLERSFISQPRKVTT